MGNPSEQSAADEAAVTDGQPGLEQFDEAETRGDKGCTCDETYEVVISGWQSRETAETLALWLKDRAGTLPSSISIEVRLS